jgi:hypothetical protein
MMMDTSAAATHAAGGIAALGLRGTSRVPNLCDEWSCPILQNSEGSARILMPGMHFCDFRPSARGWAPASGEGLKQTLFRRMASGQEKILEYSLKMVSSEVV